MHTDVVFNLFRMELKTGKQLENSMKVRDETVKKSKKEGKSTALGNENLSGIAESHKKKMEMMKGPTATVIRNNTIQLQTTLQNAGRLGNSTKKNL